MKHLNHIKSFNDQIFEEVKDIDDGFKLAFAKIQEPRTSLEYERLKKISKRGNLYKYLATGQRQLTFGMLKALHEDALEFKKNRELTQGIEKLLWRAIPLVLAPFFFPIWWISQALGVSRALNKIVIQLAKKEIQVYDNFLWIIINKINDSTFMNMAEGEIQKLTKEDWFYKSFAIEKGLLNMTKKEHLVEFSIYIVKKIQQQDDLAQVPLYYVDNEYRKFLNRKFRFFPPLPMKTKTNKKELDLERIKKIAVDKQRII
jgi:hypothetical protein